MKDFTSISCLPTFYREVFFVLMNIKGKIEIHVSQLSNANFTKQPLWKNYIFLI